MTSASNSNPYRAEFIIAGNVQCFGVHLAHVAGTSDELVKRLFNINVASRPHIEQHSQRMALMKYTAPQNMAPSLHIIVMHPGQQTCPVCKRYVRHSLVAFLMPPPRGSLQPRVVTICRWQHLAVAKRTQPSVVFYD